MVSETRTTAIMGLEAIEITVQTHICNGIPCFNIVGLPDKTIAESRERIRSAFASSEIPFPQKRITVNLSPADLFKAGNHYDLPIALSILASMGIVPHETTKNTFFVGELGLDGSLLPVYGIFPTLIHAAKHNMNVVCPEKNFTNTNYSLIGVYVDTLSNVIKYMNNEYLPTQCIEYKNELTKEQSYGINMEDVKGQEFAKLAMEIAAAGKHNLSMIGSPGVGKSMLARAFISILPDLTEKETLEVNIISSIINGKTIATLSTRPFRDPHHNISMAAMVGGGTKQIKPGEITLAHCGVLFLDELPEFQREVLEALRQPLENKRILISRACGSMYYPSDFQLITAMNPCHCGYAGKQKQRCKDSSACKRAYFNKISGPLLDRIDIFITVQDVNPIFTMTPKTETSVKIKARVCAARDFQLERYKNLPFETNSSANPNTVDQLIIPSINSRALELIKNFAEKHDVSTRSVYKTIKLARTIADLRLSDSVASEDAAQAIFYCTSTLNVI